MPRLSKTIAQRAVAQKPSGGETWKSSDPPSYADHDPGEPDRSLKRPQMPVHIESRKAENGKIAIVAATRRSKRIEKRGEERQYETSEHDRNNPLRPVPRQIETSEDHPNDTDVEE